MVMKKQNNLFNMIVISLTIVGGLIFGSLLLFPWNQEEAIPVIRASSSPSNPPSSILANQTEKPIEKPTESPTEKTVQQLVEQYRDLKLIDAHNHDASGYEYQGMLETWKRNAVNQVVLFGNVSEPSAILTDGISFNAYQEFPDLIIPFFSGFDMHDKASLKVVRENLEKGYFGLGEIAAASLYSPVLSTVAWKGNDPMDGFLPDIYEICAEYKAPILLHIDPPNGLVIDILEEALDKHPETIFIFAHANAFNSPENIKNLLEKHSNLYADFFAGYTALSPNSANKLEDFIPVIKGFPDRFILSTDSGFGLESEEAAIGAIYQLIDKIDDLVIAQKIAHDNLDSIIQNQPATKTQLEEVRKKSKETGETYELSNLSKVEAGQILWSKNE
jgi:hypothetical protein